MPAKKQTPKSATPKPKSPTSPKPGDPKPVNEAAPRSRPSPARVNRTGQPLRGGWVGGPTGRPTGPVTRRKIESVYMPIENQYEPKHRPVKTSTVPTRNPTKQDKPRGRTQSTSNKLEQSVARTSGQTRGNGGLVGGPNKNDAPKPKPGRTVPRPRATPGYYL